MSSDIRDMRWDPYILAEAAGVDDFWRGHLAGRSRDLLFLVGRGFDARALYGPRRILDCGGVGSRDLLILGFGDGAPESGRHSAMTAANVVQLKALFKAGLINCISIQLGGSAGNTTTSRNTARALAAVNDIREYTDVVIDISAMPRMIAMTVIAKLTRMLDDAYQNTGVDVNLHVVTTENAVIDQTLTGGSLSDTVTSVIGFSGRLNSEVDEHLPRIWLPVLGERQSERLSLIREKLRPDEICPVIPFPSRDPRRGDEIVDSYRQMLFDDFQVEPSNILHACEFNAFEAYKQLYGAIDRYRDALRELGGCKAFVSPLSSKLLSVGVLLACYDHAMSPNSYSNLFTGIPYVESVSYGLSNSGDDDANELYSMWIRGEWEH